MSPEDKGVLQAARELAKELRALPLARQWRAANCIEELAQMYETLASDYADLEAINENYAEMGREGRTLW